MRDTTPCVCLCVTGLSLGRRGELARSAHLAVHEPSSAAAGHAAGVLHHSPGRATLQRSQLGRTAARTPRRRHRRLRPYDTLDTIHTAAPSAASIGVSPAMGHCGARVPSLPPSLDFQRLTFSVHFGTVQRLTATLRGFVSRRFTVCDNSCCSFVVAAPIYFLHFLCDELFSFRLTFVPRRILVTPLVGPVRNSSRARTAPVYVPHTCLAIISQRDWSISIHVTCNNNSWPRL